MPRTSAVTPRSRKHLIALAASAALLPIGASAIQLAEGPPGTVMPYVAPNVILSLDDSTSMNANMFAADGTNLGWRTKVLKDAVTDVFNDYDLLPDGKIRLAWQSMGNCTKPKVGGKTIDGLALTGTSASSATQVNAMRSLEGTHRSNFMSYMENFNACTNTPTHKMVKAADDYMRADLHKNGPWAAKPGSIEKPYLGCRRNYHILLTDGGWNAGYVATSPVNYSRSTINLPDGTEYNPNNPQTKVYQNNDQVSTLADWALYSWAAPLKTGSQLSQLDGSIVPSILYTKATETETVKNRLTGESFTFEKYWNPKYNPATWPHMTTFTIGFSNDALPQRKYKYNGGTSWTNLGALTKPTDMLPYGEDGDLAGFANGTLSWHPSHHSSGTSANYPMGTSSDRGHDMWQAAINGRGRFYAVEKGEDLKKAFEEIVRSILPETDPDFSSSATSGSNITRYDVGRYVAAYEPKEAWKGFITADTIKTDGTVAPVAGWGGKNTAEWLDDASTNVATRLILSWNDKLSSLGGAVTEQGGTSFEWSSSETNLSNSQKAWLNLDATGTNDSQGQDRLNYIRGVRDKEGSTPTKPFRVRKSRQGDIINSVVWYTGAPSDTQALKGYSAFVRANKAREPMIYVGGNDGMLHGFSAETGKEKIAYVPKGAIPKLRYLTDHGFDNFHKYLVDGSPMTGDVDLGVGDSDPAAPGYASYTPDWRTLLVGTLGLGGKGYFVLDVTNPSTGAAGSAPAFLKSNAKDLVLLDRSRSELESAPSCTGLSGTQLTQCNAEKAFYENEGYADIGHITAQPVLDDTNPMRTTQITRMNNNRWAVVLGNGYNSDNQRPVLLVQYLDGAKELLRIQTTSDAKGSGKAKDNGLAAPRLVDLNGDGRVDVVYAGDNQGNMWKFDLTSINDSEWKTAFGGQPLFTAIGPASAGSARNKMQPISTAPTVKANDRFAQSDPNDASTRYRVGGMMVFFGTGRNVAETDPQSLDVQSLYSVLDNTRYEVINTILGKRLKTILSQQGTCSPTPQPDCIPAPKALGAGPGAAGANLAEQKISQVDGVKAGTIDAANSANVLDASGWAAGKNGWFLDLPTGTGERVLKPASFYDGSNILNVYSQMPAKGTDADPDIESCESSSVDEEHQWLTQLNIMDGKRPSIQIIDYNKDGLYDMNDQNITRVKIRKGAHNQIAKGDKIQDMNIKNEVELTMARMPEETMRPSWRQMH